LYVVSNKTQLAQLGIYTFHVGETV